MNKTQLIRALSDRRTMTQAEAGAIIETLFGHDDGIISTALTRGEAVAIRGFGTFEVKTRSARLARHPTTGEPLQIAATRRPTFRAAASLKTRIEDAVD